MTRSRPTPPIQAWYDVPLNAQAALPSGLTLHEANRFPIGTLGGWFRWRTTGQPVLLTTGHLIASWLLRDAEAQANHAPRPLKPKPGQAIISTHHEQIWLCLPQSPHPIARVVATGCVYPHTSTPSFDATIALPTQPHFVTPTIARLTPAIGQAYVGQTVTKMTQQSGTRHGTVIHTEWPSNWYGSPQDILIAPIDHHPFSVAGDSGALLIDPDRNSIIGLHVGQVKHREINGHFYPTLSIAHPIQPIMTQFNLTILS